MLHFLPPPLLGSIATLVMVLNILFWTIPLLIIGLAKLIIPIPAWRYLCVQWITSLISAWMVINNFFIWLLFKTEWDVSGLDGLIVDNCYLISVNHQTWLDIPVLVRVFDRRIPFPRFFLKQELIWIPVVGFVCWVLDMPFMKRYSREFLEQHPELRGKDLETTRKAVEKYKDTPVTILSFLEGTRFTPTKHERQKSPYRHLLLPKAGGIAFVLSAMGERFDAMLDVTIVYPGIRPSFWQFLSGQVPRIVVRVRPVDIPQEFLHGDYLNDPIFRGQFQTWIRALWHDKDALIKQIWQEVGDRI